MKIWIRRLLIAAVALFMIGAVGSVGTVVGIFWYYGRDIEALDEERLKNYRPPQVTRVYSRDGELIGELFDQRRIFVDYEDIPSHVENAFLAAEDADFYKHAGMDYMGMVRALVANVRAGEIKQGASTITQQVVKIFILSPERTFERKVQELILARRLEQAFTKKEILELYLNEIYLGHGRYGIEAASRFYFGTGVADIDLGQAALLATLPKAPGRDSPIKNPQRAKSRQIYVLQQMVKHGFCTAADAEPFIDAPIELVEAEQRPGATPGAEEFVDAAREVLVEQYGEEALKTLGAEVYTTVSMDLQRQTRQSIITGLQAIDERNGYARKLKPAEPKARTEAVAKGQGKLSIGAVRPAIIARHGDADLPTDGFAAHVGDHDVFIRVPQNSRHDAPEQTLPEQYPEGAVIDVEVVALPSAEPARGLPAGWAEARVSAGPQSAVVVIDVATGEVLAMAGGTEFELGDFNRARHAKRQPGSTFKPFVYGAALLSGDYTAASIVPDSPEIYEKWKPTNYLRDKYLGDIRIRVALTKSVNTVAIKLADRVGIDAVKSFAAVAGIDSALPDSLSLALGTGEVSPYELAAAYSTIARGGSKLPPTVVKEVRLSTGEVWSPERKPEQVLAAEPTFVLTSMMQSVVQQGTGAKAKELGRPAAGKTGTSADFHDAWFAGFTPQHVAVTWVGFDQPRRLGKSETGGKAAIPIWLGAMTAAEEGSDPKAFVPPDKVVARRIDAATGLLAPTGTAAEGYTGKTLEEFFVKGTEPIEEAVPAAMGAGDVVLGLYDEAPSDDETVVEDVVPPGVDEMYEEPPAKPEPSPTPAPKTRELPSLGD